MGLLKPANLPKTQSDESLGLVCVLYSGGFVQLHARTMIRLCRTIGQSEEFIDLPEYNTLLGLPSARKAAQRKSTEGEDDDNLASSHFLSEDLVYWSSLRMFFRPSQYGFLRAIQSGERDATAAWPAAEDSLVTWSPSLRYWRKSTPITAMHTVSNKHAPVFPVFLSSLRAGVHAASEGRGSCNYVGLCRPCGRPRLRLSAGAGAASASRPMAKACGSTQTRKRSCSPAPTATTRNLRCRASRRSTTRGPRVAPGVVEQGKRQTLRSDWLKTQR